MEIVKGKADFEKWVDIKCDAGTSATVFYGDGEPAKTEAEALEAAELLKQFFEAKEAGRVARLVVQEKALCPVGTVIGSKPHYISNDDYKVPGLITDEPQRPKNKSEAYCSDNGHSCLVVGQCANGCKHAPQRPTYGVIGPNPHHEPQRPKNTVIDQMNDEPPNVYERIRERVANRRQQADARREAFKIAKLAALIFAHNCNEFDERRAVASAAKILRHATEGVE